MKISKWAYSIEEGPIEPVYVYEAPVRFWHWAQCAAFFMLVITGFLIGWPPIANYATTWDTYFFGNIILLHLVCGMLFAVLMIYRIYWAFVGNKYSRMIFILPFWDMEWIKGIFGTALYYLFLNKHPKEYVGHNPLAQTAMCLMYVLGSILIILTGLGRTVGMGYRLDVLVRLGYSMARRSSAGAYLPSSSDVLPAHLPLRSPLHELP